MSDRGEEHLSEPVEISAYAEDILADEDRPLFNEAVAAANAGALRAAYVMIWLACAESLKRRFREAQTRDHNAGTIVSKIDDMEEQEKAVDHFMLDEALKYGFVSASEHVILNQIYEMRCIYAHPYEQAPSKEKLIDAASDVVSIVLSRPVKLKHGFGERLLEELLEDRNYLDDHEPAVKAFADSILPRLDEGVYGWLLDRYWSKLEEFADDTSMAVFSRRGSWFSRELLRSDPGAIFTEEEWHDRVIRFPETTMEVCLIGDIFNVIGQSAQDSLVGLILEKAQTHARSLLRLEQLDVGSSLTKRQRERFIDGLKDLNITTVTASGLSTKYAHKRIVKALESYNWYAQNPAINLLTSNGPSQVAALHGDEQEELGRNVLQAAEGTASSAVAFLERLSEGEVWPVGMIRGIVLESFINEESEFRLKSRNIGLVASALAQLQHCVRDELVSQVAATICAGTPKYRIRQNDFTETLQLLQEHSWATPLTIALDDKLPDDAHRN